MSEKPVKLEASSSPAEMPERKRSRLRRFFLRHLPLSIAGLIVLLALLAVGAYFVASSSAFENEVRKRLIANIEDATGGRAEIASFHWRLLQLEAEADGVVIHGLEDPGEAPYAQIDRLRLQVSILEIFTPHILLHDLEITKPQIHLIVYPDGTTNQPQPQKANRSGKPVLETLFDLQASHVAVEQGSIHYDNRAAAFDFQNRYAPLDFEADDVSFATRYLSASQSEAAHYTIRAGASNLNLRRDVRRGKSLPVEGRMDATVDLERTRLLLRSLEITARGKGEPEHALEVTGVLDNFTHPRWQARVSGDLDMRLLEPTTGYPDSPDGIAHLNLAAEGQPGKFTIDGRVHVDGGSYLGVGISAKGITLDAQVHADAKELLISQVIARLRQGGQIDGSVDLQPWLPSAPTATMERTDLSQEERRTRRNVLVKQAPPSVPVNGKVTANFKDVTLDTVLTIVAAPQYQRLGLDARLNGPAMATWNYGDGNNVAVTTLFALAPSGKTPQNEAPTSGTIDATYTQRNGGVNLRRLELHMPASDVAAHGSLGAYPTSRPSRLSVDFHSGNLGEFDAALKSLGFRRNGKEGTAALPVALGGQAEFHGTWMGSLAKPQIDGRLSATQLQIEMPGQDSANGEPQFVRMDSVEIDGGYSPAQISVRQAQLLHGKTRLTLSGTLEASPEPQSGFDGDSQLHMRAEGANVEVADVQPLVAASNGASLPVVGEFNTQLQMDGPLHAPAGSGWAEMDHGTIYGEPVNHVSLHGTLENQVLKLTSATVEDGGGIVTVAGSYGFTDKRFQLDAHAERIDIARIGWLHQHNFDATGKLGLSITGSGTTEDPQIDGHMTASALTFGGQRFGDLDVTAHAANHSVNYDLTTQLEGAELALHGDTQLNSDYTTRAQLDFSHFNVGALFAMAHLEAFRGESALAGKVTMEGPLAHTEQLHGEARLEELAVTVAGVALKSDGAVHATLANNRIQLDPLHVTGPETDLRAQGSLALKGTRQLDLAASGSINLKLAETLDPDLTASGVTTFQLEAHGPLQHPDLQGNVEFQNGALSLEDLPNGLSQLHGTLRVQSEPAGGEIAHRDERRRSAYRGRIPRLPARHLRRSFRDRQGSAHSLSAGRQFAGRCQAAAAGFAEQPASQRRCAHHALHGQPRSRPRGPGCAGQHVRADDCAARRALEPRAPRRAHRLFAAVELPERIRQAGRRRGPASARHAGLAFAAGPRLHHRRQRHDCRNPLRPGARRHHLHQPGPHRAASSI